MCKKLNHFMATEVRGLLLGNDEMCSGMLIYYDNGIAISTEDGWTPTTDMNQAMDCVEKQGFTTFYLWWNDSAGEWLCSLSSIRVVQEDCKWKAYGETAPLAICRALAKAKGFEYE